MNEYYERWQNDNPENIHEETVFALIEDLNGRSGFDFYDIDEDIMNAILEAHIKIALDTVRHGKFGLNS